MATALLHEILQGEAREMREAIGAETPPLPANVELCHMTGSEAHTKCKSAMEEIARLHTQNGGDGEDVYQIVSPGCTVVCAMEMGTPHTVNHIRAPYRATVQELHVANSWKVTPDGPVRAGSRVHFLTRHGWWEERFEVFDSAHGLGLRALREFKSTEPLMAYGDSVGGAMLGRKGEAKTEEAKRRLYETKGHYKSKYVMQIDRGGHTYEVDGRGCGNLVHLVNAYKTGDPGGRGRVNVHFAGQCTDGQRTYSVKKGKTIRKGDELLVVYGSYYWQELRRGMGCTQTQCAHNCPFRVNDDETEPAMGDWVQNGVVHREEDGQPTHDTGDVAESAQQSEGQLEQNTRCHNPPHILGRNKWAYASNVLVGKSWMGGLVAAKDIPAGVMIVRYSGKETDLGTEVDSEYLMVATSTKDRFERSW